MKVCQHFNHKDLHWLSKWLAHLLSGPLPVGRLDAVGPGALCSPRVGVRGSALALTEHSQRAKAVLAVGREHRFLNAFLSMLILSCKMGKAGMAVPVSQLRGES